MDLKPTAFRPSRSRSSADIGRDEGMPRHKHTFETPRRSACENLINSQPGATSCAAYIEGRVAEANAVAQGGAPGWKVKAYSPCYELNGRVGMRRAIFVSQAIETVEHFVCALYVLEYPERRDIKPSVNTGRVYVAFLDGTGHYHRCCGGGSRQLTQDVLNAYLEFASAVGFKFAHLQAAPPPDPRFNFYIFRHSAGTVRTPQGLIEYYKKFCRTFRWRYQRGISGSMALPHFLGEAQSVLPFMTQEQQQQVLSSMFEIDLTVHCEAGQYRDVSEWWKEPSCQRDFLWGCESLSFASVEENQASTRSLLLTWIRNGMPVQDSNSTASRLMGADETFRQLRHRRMSPDV